MFSLEGTKIKYTVTQKLLIGVLVCCVVFNYNFSMLSVLNMAAAEEVLDVIEEQVTQAVDESTSVQGSVTEVETIVPNGQSEINMNWMQGIQDAMSSMGNMRDQMMNNFWQQDNDDDENEDNTQDQSTGAGSTSFADEQKTETSQADGDASQDAQNSSGVTEVGAGSGTTSSSSGSGGVSNGNDESTSEDENKDKFGSIGDKLKLLFGSDYEWEPTEEKEVNTNDVDSDINDANNQGGGDEDCTDDCNTSASGDGGSQSDDSTVSAGIGENNETEIGINNQTEMNNDQDIVANSGDNLIQSDGKMEGSLETGNASLTGEQEVKANNNEVSGAGGWNWAPWTEIDLGEDLEDDDSGMYIDGVFRRDFSFVAYNEAVIDNKFDALANTGRNRIIAGEKVKDFVAKTGNVFEKVSLINLVNINSIDSIFKPIVVNIGKEWMGGSLDLMEILLEKFGIDGGIKNVEALAQPMGDDSVNSTNMSVEDNIRVQTENQGLIFNDITLEGISGQNRILSGYKLKEVALDTGDVDISFNLFNLLNANFLFSDVTFAVVNVLDDFSGDIILPTPQDLFPKRFTPAQQRALANIEGLVGDDSVNQALAVVTNDTDITVDNNADFDTSVETIANSGNNTMFFDDKSEDATINTGGAKTRTNFMSLVNQTVVGGTGFFGFFNMFGNWAGKVIDLPENALVQGDDKSFVISVDNFNQAPEDLANIEASIEGNGEETDDSINQAIIEYKQSMEANLKNEGKIVNDIKILADSGSNDMAAIKGKVTSIDTGDVKISANISNFMNTNFIGAGIMKLAVNVFADNFDGNIVFGKATDVTVNMTVSTGLRVLRPGDLTTYNIEVANIHEDQPAEGEVVLTFDNNKMEAVGVGGGQVNGNQISWSLGELNPGGVNNYQAKLKVKSLSPGIHNIQAQAGVDLDKADRDKDNNSHVVNIQVLSEEDDTSTDVGSGGGNNYPPVAGEADGAGSAQDGTGDEDSDGGEYSVETAMTDDESGTSNQGNNSEANNTANGGNSNGGESSPVASNSSSNYSAAPSVLSVTKSNESGGRMLNAGDNVIYHISVKNTVNSSLYDVVAHDELIDETGQVIYSTSWPLEEVYPLEEIVIDYEINLLVDAIAGGRYTNYAYVSGFDTDHNRVVSQNAESVINVATNSNYNPNFGADTSMTDGVGGGSDILNDNTDDAIQNVNEVDVLGTTGAEEAGNRWQMVSANEFEELNNNEEKQTGVVFGAVDINRAGPPSAGNQRVSKSNQGINETPQVVKSATDLGVKVQQVKLVEKETKIFRNVPIAPIAVNAAQAAEWQTLGEDILSEEAKSYSRPWMWLILLGLVLVGGYYSWQEKNKKNFKKQKSLVSKEWKYILKNMN